MLAKINNLITKKTFLGFLLCVIVFLVPVSASYTQNDGSEVQRIEGQILLVSAEEGKTSLVGAMLDVPKKGFWDSVGLWLGNTLLSVASMFTYVGGTLLDKSLTMTVFEMGKHMDQGLGSKINDTWKIIRDISNLAFIFGFVYIGIRTIIDPESASTKRFLSKIIIGALLINFSLFFVKFIIDFSNFTAYHIYNAMVSGEGSLSATVANMLGIVSLFTSSDPNQFAQITGGGMFWFFILGAVLLLVVAFVFFAAAIHLVVRFVALVLIMVGSPILFAATVFPQTEHYASDMWKKLISYAFFAPVFLLLILISLTLVQGLGTAIVPAGSSFVSAMKGGSANTGAAIGQMGIILNFVIIIFFFIQSLLLAQKMGVAGGDAAVSMGNKLRTQGQRYLGNATFGAAGAVGRASVGQIAHRISESDNLKETASKRTLGGWAARQSLKASRVAGDASFDARNINGLGNAIGAGEGRKGGYKTVLGEVEKKEKEFATSLGEVGDDDVRVEARKKGMQGKEKELRGLEEELRGLNPQSPTYVQDRKDKREEIEKKKKEVEDEKIKYESEKQRRVIGSTFANDDRSQATQHEVFNKEQTIEAKKAEIKKKWEGDHNNGILAYADPFLSNQDKKARRSEIENLNKELEGLKKEHRAFLNKQKDQGYAGVLESSKLYTAWPVGRLVTHEQEAGKAIRKSAEKGLPKKKDD